ncbi:MAG: DDE-type integrase/transposase/recombinase [Bradyrhizobium sp.]
MNAKKVLRLMREDNLLAQRKTPFLKPPAERPSGVLVVPNLIRGLAPSAPDQIWVADITYVHLAKAFAYLAVILDAFSRKVVAGPSRTRSMLLLPLRLWRKRSLRDGRRRAV